MKKEQKTRTENFITSLELPKDVILKDADIHIMGNHEILIENHRGLLLFEFTISREYLSSDISYSL